MDKYFKVNTQKRKKCCLLGMFNIFFIYQEDFFFESIQIKTQRDGFMVEGAYCSCRGP